jgi:signal transduction histidine kinase
MVTDITLRKRLEERIIRQKVQQQKEITKAALQVQEKERNFLGSELHDNINQILAAVKLQLKHYLDSTDAAKDFVSSSHSYLEMAITEIRKLSQRLVTHRFDDDSFVEAIHSLIEGLSIDKIVALNVDELRMSVRYRKT